MQNQKYRRLIRNVNFYPPFLGAGIRMVSHAEDFTRFEVQLRMNRLNRNLFGTHFGGSLYAMCDPFYAFILTMSLGQGYIVWDKSASIDFLKPAKGTITCVFELSRKELDRVKEEVDRLGKQTFFYETYLLDEQGTRVAKVRKEVYARRKPPKDEDAKP